MTSAKVYLFFSLGCAVVDREAHIRNVALYCRRAAEKAAISLTDEAFMKLAGMWLSGHGALSLDIKGVLLDAVLTARGTGTDAELRSLVSIAHAIEPSSTDEATQMVKLLSEKMGEWFDEMDERFDKVDEGFVHIKNHITETADYTQYQADEREKARRKGY